jgi:hypothetical protein
MPGIGPNEPMLPGTAGGGGIAPFFGSFFFSVAFRCACAGNEPSSEPKRPVPKRSVEVSSSLSLSDDSDLISSFGFFGSSFGGTKSSSVRNEPDDSFFFAQEGGREEKKRKKKKKKKKRRRIMGRELGFSRVGTSIQSRGPVLKTRTNGPLPRSLASFFFPSPPPLFFFIIIIWHTWREHEDGGLVLQRSQLHGPDGSDAGRHLSGTKLKLLGSRVWVLLRPAKLELLRVVLLFNGQLLDVVLNVFILIVHLFVICLLMF